MLRRHRTAGRIALGASLIAAGLLASCSSRTAGRSDGESPRPGPASSAGQSPASSAAASSGAASSAASSSAAASSAPPPPPPADVAEQALAGMSEAARVGQLFMVGTPATGKGETAVEALTRYDVGSVILTGRSRLGVAATAALSAALQVDAAGVPLFIATDQEGGQVQVLQGPGFSSMPSGLDQGTQAPSTLRAKAARWGAHLLAAGVNVDLGPVLDTVPSAQFAPSNPPIGAFDREYGFTPATVAAHGTAFAQGLADAGVDATVKHFPGLGRVTANTDVSSGVTDTQTVRGDAYLAPFQTAVQAGVPWVMVSTAFYAKIDPGRPAAFSPVIVTSMLRGDLGFAGVIVSDDVGNAAQLSAYSPPDRALNFIAAGGDVVLTVNSTQIPAMTSAVLARTQTDPMFRAQVDAAALTVLRAKHNRGLL
jgi:beta-N-acetylhexosaminidase